MRREDLVVDDLVQPAIRLVVDAQPPLFFDDFALADERLVVDPQRRHAVGFLPEYQRQILRRRGFPERRLVFGGERVALPADRRDRRRVAFGLHVLRALEHQVLEQMREPGASRPLVFRPDVIRQVHVDDGDGMIFFEDDREAVRERGDFVLQLRRTDSGGQRGRRDGTCADSQRDAYRAPRHLSCHVRQLSPTVGCGALTYSRCGSRRSPTTRARSRPATRRAGAPRQGRARDPLSCR